MVGSGGNVRKKLGRDKMSFGAKQSRGKRSVEPFAREPAKKSFAVFIWRKGGNGWKP